MVTHSRRRLLVNTALLVGAIVAGVFGAATLEAIEIGEQAPDFELPSTSGGTVKLSQFLGKQAVLIEFYGADFAPV
jgi:peroxiredoxin Q/BCP